MNKSYMRILCIGSSNTYGHDPRSYNDLLEGASAKQTCARMEEYLDSITGLGKQILLIAPPPFERGECVQSETVMRESQKQGSLYRDLAARKGCLFADAGEWNIEMTFDGIHFSSNGHDIFAQKLDEIMFTIVAAKREGISDNDSF